MAEIIRYAGQIAFFAFMAIVIGYFSSRPVYRQVPDGMAQIKLSFAHGAARKVDCRRLTPKEIAKLPPNKRRPNTCARERIAMHVQLSVDSVVVYDQLLEPTGLSRDGPARTYKKFLVSAGSHVIVARLRDSKRPKGFDYETTHRATLKPKQNLAVDFKADKGGFLFR
jgi:hypothetical protein